MLSDMALLRVARSPSARAVRRSSWSSSARASWLIGSFEVSFFRYARSVREACSVATFSEPKPRRLFELFFLEEFRDGKDGRRLILDWGLTVGGLPERLSLEGRLLGVSAPSIAAGLVVSSETGGLFVFEPLRLYCDLLLASVLGGDFRPVVGDRLSGVAEGRWNSASSVLDRTRLRVGLPNTEASLSGDVSRAEEPHA